MPTSPFLSCYANTNKAEKISLIPVFIPFFGCPQICIFCNQKLQTGVSNQKFSSDIRHSSAVSSSDFSNNYSKNLTLLLENAKQQLIINKENALKSEIAFYGGTFSALPEIDFQLCLDFIEECKKEKLLAKARCSTRPDALTEERLQKMKKKGIDTIELGIQSFNTKILEASHRFYTKEIAINACKQVKEYGFKLCIQLLPNLPLQVGTDFLEDIDIALEHADYMRFYPCLVVEGTKLALLYKEGKHTIWNFDDTITLLAKALYKSWQAQIPVIRIGVAYEKDFYKEILAGVSHPSLGQLVQEKAIELAVDTLYQKNISSSHFDSSKKYVWEFPLSAKGYLAFKNNKDFYSKRKITKDNRIWHDGNSLNLYENNHIDDND